MLSKTLSRLSLGLALLMTIGCGSGDGFRVVQVSGKVTYEGKPLAGGGTISFIPTGEGKAAGGEINDDGSYTLNTYSTGDGAVIGTHRVEIRQNITLEEAVWPPVPEGEEPPKDHKPTKEAVLVPESERIPAIYSSGESPLTAEVKEARSDLNFDLQPQ